MIELTQVVEREVHKSRWGYHACSYEVFAKLKQLAEVVRRERRICRQFARWFRKSPHNRVARRKIRNEKGWVVSYGDAVPVPEPRSSAFELSAKLAVPCHVRVGDQLIQVESHVDILKLSGIALDILRCRNVARRPMPTLNEVIKLSLSEAEINRLYERLVSKEVKERVAAKQLAWIQKNLARAGEVS